jgi:3-hydroxyacyl-CoA dehydrogenase/enoyl-CoA hydratase/3-hydroxybutyryl-CoA epimerase
MQLVEVIVGKETSENIGSIDYVTAIGKVPIIVNDGQGFFKSFCKFINEGIAMLTEGSACCN